MCKLAAKTIKTLGAMILWFAAIFYLFVVPMMAAKGILGDGWLGVSFGAFMLAQVFLTVFLYTWEAMSPVYGLPKNILLRVELFKKVPAPERKEQVPERIRTCMLIGLAYPMFIYAFAVLYVFVSKLSPDSFNTSSELSGFNAFYFSLVTATTVGFGDISPTSMLSKSIVILQVLLSLLYGVLVLAAISNFLQNRQNS